MEAAVAAAPATEVQSSTPAQAAGSAAPPTSVLGTSTGPEWLGSLAPELKSSPSLGKFKDIGSLAKSYLEQEKAIMAPKLPMPQPTWTEKEYGDLYGKLGRPEKPDGYEFRKPDGMPEGLSYDEVGDKAYSEQAHKLGLSKAQATALREWEFNRQAEKAKGYGEGAKQEAAARAEGLAALQREYGPKWDQNVSAAQAVVRELGGKDMQEYLTKTGLGDDPRIIKFMMKIGSTLQDHSVIRGTPALGGQFANSPAAAASEIQRLMTDKDFQTAVTSAHHPQHDAVLEKWRCLHQVAYPNK